MPHGSIWTESLELKPGNYFSVLLLWCSYAAQMERPYYSRRARSCVNTWSLLIPTQSQQWHSGGLLIARETHWEKEAGSALWVHGAGGDELVCSLHLAKTYGALSQWAPFWGWKDSSEQFGGKLKPIWIIIAMMEPDTLLTTSTNAFNSHNNCDVY